MEKTQIQYSCGDEVRVTSCLFLGLEGEVRALTKLEGDRLGIDIKLLDQFVTIYINPVIIKSTQAFSKDVLSKETKKNPNQRVDLTPGIMPI